MEAIKKTFARCKAEKRVRQIVQHVVTNKTDTTRLPSSHMLLLVTHMQKARRTFCLEWRQEELVSMT
jgi:hypothetical protein